MGSSGKTVVGPLVPESGEEQIHRVQGFVLTPDTVKEGRIRNKTAKFTTFSLTCQSSQSSDEGLTLETSAFESLYGGQFTLSTPLINQVFVYHSPTDAAPLFLQKLIPPTYITVRFLLIIQL